MQVLIAIGGSKHSQIALQQCVLLAQKQPVSGTILTVIKEKEEEANAVSLLQNAVQTLETAVSDLKTKIRSGEASEQILEEARSNQYDILIIGEKLHHNLLTRFLGPTTLRIIAQLPCPVLIAKQAAHPLKQILVCDSIFAKPNLLERFSHLFPEIISHAPQVTVLHVMSQIAAAPGIQGQQLRANVDELMNVHSPEGDILIHDVKLLSEINVKAEPIVRHGLVVEEILAEAENGRYDLIVIGAHSHVGWQHFLLEDVAAQIVLKADRPILVIP